MNRLLSDPILFTKNDLYGHRVRIMVAEKRAAIQTRIIGVGEPPPEWLQHVNPRGIYPFLADKDIVCHGSALDEFLHERFPAPALMPTDPLSRARDRMLANEVIRWYRMKPEQIAQKLSEVEYILDPSVNFLLGYLSTVDIALAPILYRSRLTSKLEDYAQQLLSRPAFDVSLKDSNPSFTDEFLAETTTPQRDRGFDEYSLEEIEGAIEDESEAEAA